MRRFSSAFTLSAFTLIELLIVVAIIAILAAIAVPNFLAAQTRSKVSRVKADHRTLATALEAYAVDNRVYPYNNAALNGRISLIPLSTPVSYLTSSHLIDPFGNAFPAPDGLPRIYVYLSSQDSDFVVQAVVPFAFPGNPQAAENIYSQRWFLASAGPDRQYRVQQIAIANGGNPNAPTLTDFVMVLAELGGTGSPAYDPSNGIVSIGDINRTQKGVYGENGVR